MLISKDFRKAAAKVKHPFLILENKPKNQKNPCKKSMINSEQKIKMLSNQSCA